MSTGRPLWRFVLPIVGIICFAAQTYRSDRFNQHLAAARGKYYWWASIRLDSDPLGRNAKFSQPDKSADGREWQLVEVWDGSGSMARGLMLIALPAFAVGAICVRTLGHIGISQVRTFMVAMPLLIGAWFYFVGWLIDRSVRKHVRGDQQT
jgi:hypothetical protein